MLLIRVSIVLRSLTRARAVTDVNFWSSEQEENPHQWLIQVIVGGCVLSVLSCTTRIHQIAITKIVQIICSVEPEM